MSFNIESFYRASIVQNILDTDTCPFNCNVSKLPVLTSGLLTISPNTDNEEIIEYTHAGTPGAAGVISIVKRAIKPSTVVAYASWVSGTDYQVTANLKSHTLNDSIRGDINHIHINQAQNETGAAKVSKSGDTMTGKLQFSGTTHAGIKLNSLTTTQRDALTPAVGDKIINTTTGTEQTYIGGAWNDAGTATVANASETVTGKVQLATSAQSIAGTDTDTDPLVVKPSDIAKNTQSGTFVYGTDAGGDDTYVITLTPVLTAYTTGQKLTFTPTTSNTGACSVNFGPSVLNIKTKDGNDPQTGVIRALTPITGTYDGTNFVIDTEDFSTEVNRGVIEIATSAEALTGTDTVRAMTPSTTKDSIKDSVGVVTTGLSFATNYQASVSGLVTAYGVASTSTTGTISGYVGVTNPASTLLVTCGSTVQQTQGSVCFPVKKGYWYRVDVTGTFSGGMSFTPNA